MSTTTPPTGSPRGDADVVVVGAGLSGLICARCLHRSGLKVRLLEARERWGGRMNGGSSAAGIPVDLGGQWVGASHRHLLALLSRGSRPAVDGMPAHEAIRALWPPPPKPAPRGLPPEMRARACRAS